MTRARARELLRARRGSAALEFGLAAPVLLLLMALATDLIFGQFGAFRATTLVSELARCAGLAQPCPLDAGEIAGRLQGFGVSDARVGVAAEPGGCVRALSAQGVIEGRLLPPRPWAASSCIMGAA